MWYEYAQWGVTVAMAVAVVVLFKKHGNRKIKTLGYIQEVRDRITDNYRSAKIEHAGLHAEVQRHTHRIAELETRCMAIDHAVVCSLKGHKFRYHEGSSELHHQDTAIEFKCSECGACYMRPQASLTEAEDEMLLGHFGFELVKGGK